MVAGFGDGMIRVLVLSLKETKKRHPPRTEFINLIQVMKAHDQAITVMSINEKGNLLVTGSKEARIFVFHIKQELKKKYVCLEPIGFVPVASSVTHLNWKPSEVGTAFITNSMTYGARRFNPYPELNKKYVCLEPMGFVAVASSVTHLNWKPSEVSTAFITYSMTYGARRFNPYPEPNQPNSSY